MREQGRTGSWWLWLGALALAGCAGRVPPQVARVAAHDLSCEQVDVAKVGADRYAATGCGRGAIYAEVCQEAGCRWGRLRHGHEESIVYAQPGQQGAREVLPAPPPASHEVLPAPAPEPRQVIPAPPPDGAAAPGADGPQNVTPAPASATPTDSPLQAGASSAAYAQGDLSAPYQAQVPTEQAVQQVTQPPPAPLVETRPLPPASSYVWISGYWWWGAGASWVWVPGYWCPPYYGYAYIPGRWYWSTGYWWYGPGGWARPGTTVIINQRVPPRPNTAIVRSFTPHRVGPAVSNPGRVVHAPRGSFAPRGSPLYGASPRGAASSRVVHPAPQGSRFASPAPSGTRYNSPYGAPGIGRVVAPGSTVRPRSSYGGSYSAPQGSSGGYSAPRGGWGGSAMPRSSGGYSAPRGYSGGGGGYSAPRGGGGGYSAPRGGGGGGYSAPRGGGGGGGGSMRVSPGGGGGRRR